MTSLSLQKSVLKDETTTSAQWMDIVEFLGSNGHYDISLQLLSMITVKEIMIKAWNAASKEKKIKKGISFSQNVQIKSDSENDADGDDESSCGMSSRPCSTSSDRSPRESSPDGPAMAKKTPKGSILKKKLPSTRFQEDSSAENTPRRSPPPRRKGARFASPPPTSPKSTRFAEITSPTPTSPKSTRFAEITSSPPSPPQIKGLHTPELKIVAGEIVADAVNKGVAMAMAEDAVNKGVAMEIVADVVNKGVATEIVDDAVKRGAQFVRETSNLSSHSVENEEKIADDEHEKKMEEQIKGIQFKEDHSNDGNLESESEA